MTEVTQLIMAKLKWFQTVCWARLSNILHFIPNFLFRDDASLTFCIFFNVSAETGKDMDEQL